MPLLPPPRRLRLPALALVVVLVGGCGSDRTGGPQGGAVQVVGLAPRRTLVAGLRARFDVAGPRSHVTGSVDLGTVTEKPSGSWPAALPVFSHPLAAVELVRGAVNVTSYGGQAVRGVSAFRYEVDLAPDKAARLASPAVRSVLQALDNKVRGPTLFADVWVDGRGRLLRVQLPLDPNARRPRGYSKETVDVVTVDLFDYSRE